MIHPPKTRGRRVLPGIATVALLGGAAFGAITLSPAVAQQARSLGSIVNSVLTCHSASACAGGINTGSGFGVLAVSSSTNGVDSATKNQSGTTLRGRSGVYGHDDSTDFGALNVGVAGSSQSGTGMQGTSTFGAGVLASTNSWYAVDANATEGVGLRARAGSTGPAIIATSVGGDAIDATAMGSSNQAAITAWSSGSAAIFASSTGKIGVDVELGSGDKSPALYAMGGTADQNANLIEGYDTNGASTFTVDNAGNEHITGQLFTKGTCSLGCSRTHRVTSYAPRESMPSMEDIGEGQLVSGATHIKLDPAFANVIDKGAPYAVFVSPEGPNHGLYVTQKSQTGFTVMENPGGHSTIPFSYRIVAKPYGVTAARLPMTSESTSPRHQKMPRLPMRHATQRMGVSP